MQQEGNMDPAETPPVAAPKRRLPEYSSDTFRQSIRFAIKIVRSKAARLPDLVEAEAAETACRQIESLAEAILDGPDDLLRAISEFGLEMFNLGRLSTENPAKRMRKAAAAAREHRAIRAKGRNRIFVPAVAEARRAGGKKSAQIGLLKEIMKRENPHITLPSDRTLGRRLGFP
jgi:hypothetical protein